jgi:hypothetical protein
MTDRILADASTTAAVLISTTTNVLALFELVCQLELKKCVL